MFDDLKPQQSNQGGNNQPSENNVSQGNGQGNMPVQNKSAVARPSSVDDMFGDVDPVAEQGKVDPSKPSAVQSGKIRPKSQTSMPEANVGAAPATNINQNISSNTVPNNNPQIAPSDSMDIVDDSSSGPMRKIIIVVLVVVLLAIVGGGVYYFFLRTSDILNFDNNTVENNNASFNDTGNQNVNNNIQPEQDIEDINENELDQDSDGLSNEEERRYGTNPLEADTDNDGVFDQDEVEIYDTDPLADDSDNDDISDYEEIFTYGTDPNDPDTDGDGFFDGVEILNDYNPLGAGKLEDLGDQKNIEVENNNTNTNANNNTNENL